MVRVRRYPEQKPKRPLKPHMSYHFSANWHERTDRSLRDFWQGWRSAQFLGETEEIGRSLKPTHWGKTRRVQYYAVGEWVVLMASPVTGQPKLLSVWERGWFDQQWRAAVRQSEAEAARTALRAEREQARRERIARADHPAAVDG